MACRLQGAKPLIIWSNAGTLLIGPMGTNFLIEIYVFLFKKMPLKLSWGNWRPFCLSLNVLNWARDFPKSMNGSNMLLTQVKEWSGARCHHLAVGITMPFILAQGIIVSDNGLVPNRRQAIIWTNDQGKLSILSWNFHIVTLMRVYVYISTWQSYGVYFWQKFLSWLFYIVTDAFVCAHFQSDCSVILAKPFCKYKNTTWNYLFYLPKQLEIHVHCEHTKTPIEIRS